MRFIITSMDGYELHLYINDECCGFLDFDTFEDAWETKQHLLTFCGL